MRKLVILFLLGIMSIQLSAQPADYYNSVVGLEGSALKAALNNIIDGHIEYEYGTVKQILRLSDEDPSNPDNIILLYTGWSIPKSNFASNMDSLNFWNREHVWAKSHGDFGTLPGPGTDAHAIRPVDATVNSARSYKDFDDGGSEYFDAGVPTGCFSDGNSWEPRDEVKGDVARMIFYMSTRYEGENGDLDLEVVDYVNTFPAAEHGKLSTLLAWNQMDPPDAFEKDRNDMVHNWQNNRNPFIDYPEFAELIWSGVSVNPIEVTNILYDPSPIAISDPVEISAQITHSSGGSISAATLTWGLSWSSMTNSINMSNSGSTFTAQLPGQPALTRVYYRIEATDGTDTKYFYAFYNVPNEPFTGTLTSIYDIQGQASASPLQGQTISTSGIVTGAFGANFFLQDGTGPWNGVYVYSSGYFPMVGDSVIVTAEVDEYYDLTELKNVSAYYFISSYNPLPAPVVLPSGSMQDEQYEACIVRLQNATCVRDTSFGMWFVNDGSGDALIHNSSIYGHNYVIGNVYDITGPLHYDFGEFKIELRSEEDVQAGIDSQAPSVVDFDIVNSSILNIYFSEEVDAVTGSDPANYNIDNGITVNGANLHAFDKTKVILSISDLGSSDYVLTIDGVEDLFSNATSNLEVNFSFPPDGIEDSFFDEISLWPNPATDIVNVKFENGLDENVKVEVFDIYGRVVTSEIISASTNIISISVENLNAGVFLISIETSKRNYLSKIVIE